MTQVDLTTILDCTLRDGGYYTAWDFTPELISRYLEAMRAAQVDIVELGFRFLGNEGFKGACAYTTDNFIRNLDVPDGLAIGVMINGADLLTELGAEKALERLFPETAETSPVELVRVACHLHEFERVLPASRWLSQRGYKVGFNLMQIAGHTHEEVRRLASTARAWPIAVLYFADSMGSMNPSEVVETIGWLREGWHGALGIHAHDNMGLALQNTLRAHAEGVTWLDATITGMGRGPGNARMEELLIEMEDCQRGRKNLVPLLAVIREYFKPLKVRHGWGSNPFYYLSGKYGIHPSYVQEMLVDPRYGEEDVLAAIEYLRREGGQRFRRDTLDSTRNFYGETPTGIWTPATLLKGREVLLLGAGSGIVKHRQALEAYIRRASPVVIAMNTQADIDAELIDLRVACHPVRLLADCETHARLPHPLITPVSRLPESLLKALQGKALLDFGLGVKSGTFSVSAECCVTPNSLVIGYALAVAFSGCACRILLAGFDGYVPGDSRNHEMQELFNLFSAQEGAPALVSVTETTYDIGCSSIYGM
ncbi:aldolase catalytic domain-containing protein [Stutzerimonas nitrititolerans]|uniref:aldolase catalytic domain-containing protein n=1 Tax=Stutzerimonas nitrititolerans TaxID=2482751 RepID=UPI0007187CFD|nr:aldolase catalytic domain-containing protein [Stutzerimonas nitrititolerans]KRW72744.1 aldolase [Pseudomonas sp. TTU2014-066ASC]